MSITKLLALILSFQASVQAVTLQEQYEEYVKEKKTEDAKRIATKLVKLKELGIKPTTRIVENLEEASSFSEWCVYSLICSFFNTTSTLKTLQTLKELKIDPATRIVEELKDASSLAETYLHCLANNMVESTKRTLKTLQTLQGLNIDPTTNIKRFSFGADNLAELFVHYLVYNKVDLARNILEQIQKLQELHIDPTTRIVEDFGKASSLAEKYLWCLVHDKSAESILAQIKILQGLGIAPTTKIVEELNPTHSFADRYVYYLANNMVDLARNILEQIQKLQELHIDPTTRIVEELNPTHSFADRYAHFLANKMQDDADRISGQIKTLQGLNIDPSTKIVRYVYQADTLAEQYVHYLANNKVDLARNHYLANNMVNLARNILEEIQTLQGLNIDPSTKIVRYSYEASNVAELLVHCINYGKDVESIAKKINEWNIDLKTSIADYPHAPTLPEQYFFWLAYNKHEDAARTLKQIQRLQDLGIALTTKIVDNPKDASNVEELLVHYIGLRYRNTEAESIEKDIKEGKITSTTKIVKNFEDAHNLSEQYAYCVAYKMPVFAKLIAKQLETLRASGIDPDTQSEEFMLEQINALKALEELGVDPRTRILEQSRIVKQSSEALNLAEEYIYYLVHGKDKLPPYVLEQLKKFKKFGVPSNTRIVEIPEGAYTLEELLAHYLAYDKSEDAGRTLKTLQTLQGLNISPRTKIVRYSHEASTLAELLAHYLAYDKSEDAGHTLEQINTLKGLNIDPTTNIKRFSFGADNLAELFVHYLVYNKEYVESIAKKINEWEIKSPNRINIKKDADITDSLVEKYFHYLAYGKDNHATLSSIQYHYYNNIRYTTSNKEETLKKINTLQGLNIDPKTHTVSNDAGARSFAEKVVCCINSKQDVPQELNQKINILRKLNVNLNTLFLEIGSIEERLVFRLNKNLSIDNLIEKLNAERKLALVAEKEVKDAPSKKVEKDDSELEQKEGVVLLPEKQERKEELPEMNEEENVSLKRKNPDSKSE